MFGLLEMQGSVSAEQGADIVGVCAAQPCGQQRLFAFPLQGGGHLRGLEAFFGIRPRVYRQDGIGFVVFQMQRQGSLKLGGQGIGGQIERVGDGGAVGQQLGGGAGKGGRAFRQMQPCCGQRFERERANLRRIADHGDAFAAAHQPRVDEFCRAEKLGERVGGEHVCARQSLHQQGFLFRIRQRGQHHHGFAAGGGGQRADQIARIFRRADVDEQGGGGGLGCREVNYLPHVGGIVLRADGQEAAERDAPLRRIGCHAVGDAGGLSDIGTGGCAVFRLPEHAVQPARRHGKQTDSRFACGFGGSGKAALLRSGNGVQFVYQHHLRDACPRRLAHDTRCLFRRQHHHGGIDRLLLDCLAQTGKRLLSAHRLVRGIDGNDIRNARCGKTGEHFPPQAARTVGRTDHGNGFGVKQSMQEMGHGGIPCEDGERQPE